MADGWALRAPFVGGYLIRSTFAQDRATCWELSFRFMSLTLGDIDGTPWGDYYYKRLRASQAWARRHGWRMVRVNLVEVP